MSFASSEFLSDSSRSRGRPASGYFLQCSVIIAGLCGPAIGAFGIYGVSLLVLVVPFWLVRHTRHSGFPCEQIWLVALGASVLAYVLVWAIVSGGERWAFAHLAIILLSGSALVAASVMSCYRGAASQVLRWFTAFMWVLLWTCAIEALTGL